MRTIILHVIKYFHRRNVRRRAIAADARRVVVVLLDPLMGAGKYGVSKCALILTGLRRFINHLLTYLFSAISNNMKLVHWPLMSGRLHLAQRGGAWAGWGPAHSPPRSTKCTSAPING